MSFSEFDQFRRQMNQLLYDMDRAMASTWGPMWEEPMWLPTQQSQPLITSGQGQGRTDKEDVKSQGGDRERQTAAAAAAPAAGAGTAMQAHPGQQGQTQLSAAPRHGAHLALRPFRTHVDVIEGKEKYEVHAELPGMRKQDIQVHVDPQNNTLTLAGESKHSVDEHSKDRTYIRMERSYGSFSRTMQLPADVDQSKINAKYDNGILVVELPRMQVQPQLHTKRALQIQ